MSTVMNPSPLQTETASSHTNAHMLSPLKATSHGSPSMLNLGRSSLQDNPSHVPLRKGCRSSQASPCHQDAEAASRSPSPCDVNESSAWPCHNVEEAESGADVASGDSCSHGEGSKQEHEQDLDISAEKRHLASSFLRATPVEDRTCSTEEAGNVNRPDTAGRTSYAIIDDDDNDKSSDKQLLCQRENVDENMDCEVTERFKTIESLQYSFDTPPTVCTSLLNKQKYVNFVESGSSDINNTHKQTESDKLNSTSDQGSNAAHCFDETQDGTSSSCSDEVIEFIEDNDCSIESSEKQKDRDFTNAGRTSFGQDSNEQREEDENEDEEDDDPVECADCNKVFINLQAYMDHTCYRSKQPDEDVESPPQSFSCSDDAESFRGDIVYTPSGSAYILEAGGIDPDQDLDLTPEAIVVREGQSLLSVQQSLPRIENAVFVHKQQNFPWNSVNLHQQRQGQPSHGMTSFDVYDLKSIPAEALLSYFINSAPEKEQVPKAVLMCFICKFSFGYQKSFLRHALCDHGLTLNDTEKVLIGRPITSAIIHIQGKEKLPNVLVLKPVCDKRKTEETQIVAISQGTPECVRKDEESGIPTKHTQRTLSFHENKNSDVTWSRDVSKSKQNNDFRPSVISEVGQISVSHSPIPQSLNGMRVDLDNCSRRRSPLLVNSHELVINARSPQLPTSISSPNPYKAIKYSHPKSPVPQQRRVDSPPTHQEKDPRNTGSITPLSSSPGASLPTMPPLIMMSSTSGFSSSPHRSSHSIPPHLGMHALPPSSSTVGINMHSFFPGGGCEDHAPGAMRSGECAKCDLALAVSSTPLAVSIGGGSGNGGGPGHMTLSHSRNSCKTLKCPKCNWHYKYQETLEIHMKEKHPDSDAQCVYCLTNQPHPRLARGESYSCGYKPYRCEVCNYSTTTKGNLSIHMQSDKHINNMQDLASGGVDIKMAPQHPHQHQSHQSLQHHQHQQAPSTQSLPPSSGAHTVTASPSLPFSLQQEESSKMKHGKPVSTNITAGGYSVSGNGNVGGSNIVSKQKQSFRCDVCSYETSVARNLRIHMTSEKHTHNMLVMSQSMSQLHQDFSLHQMSQMNQLLALTSHQEQQAAAAAAAARFAVLNNSRHPHQSPHLTAQMFPYDQMAALQIMSAAAASSTNSSSSSSSSAVPSSNISNDRLSLHRPSRLTANHGGFEMPVNLAKDMVGQCDVELSGDSHHPMISTHDAQKLFSCCVCNKFVSDSLEHIHNHIQYDRTKAGNSDTQVTFNNGTYHCNLCTYKTHLKANFQLHCKTDKHLQKLQLVNHIQEGGPENEWRMANFISSIPSTNSSNSSTSASSPMQICCNACGFYANSSHKMQLHLSTIQHESSAQLFKHLQLLEHATPPPAAGNVRFYQCSLCGANFHTKQRLVLHARSPQHLHKEQALPVGQVSIFNVFLIKEMDAERGDFEDSGK
ncbi:Zinc finger homeobox protein 3 [Plakobranchus ocellatus]|uniref:Zinc finger homeobox protein 3 n=1 Tax=Plakobranchus ocellatus TaxID=259542 RepID=A0AAV3YT66_9GAST|nr:Zinc finger homeobox protein 3 [Plakobranchus ocellatus]